VPVAGRLRFAYLTPIVAVDGEVVGVLAVDVGWSDDLDHVNGVLRRQAITWTIVVLGLLAVGCTIVMFLAFRPLRRLVGLAQRVGAGTVPDEVPLRSRRDEIGDLANALAKVVDLQADLGVRADRDDLTGLPNRSHLARELGERIARHREDDDGFALLLIDLDQFKEVNDGLGHAAGDELLIALTAALREAVLPGEFLARLGGDEFALISTAVWAEIDVDEVATRVTEAITSVTRTSTADITVTSSIGIVLIPQQADTVEIALGHADLALYRAKRSGRAHWQFYRSSFSAPIQRRLHLATELRRAIDAREITLAYQPQFHTATKLLGGLEALARWNHPVEGAIPPDEFIGVAESAGLIADLGAYLLDLACAQIATWRAAGFIVPPVSVNVSTIQLWQADFHSFVCSVLERHGLPPESLCLELTESVVVHHADGRSRNVLQRLAESGVKLSIDDFGTGYSALAYLRDLDVHQVKIDRSFIADDGPDSGREPLFAGITSLGHSLGLQVVAEGIETEAELEIARRHSCDLVQGYLLSRPAPPESIPQFFASRPMLASILHAVPDL
jgi:diguanylate cyclase (GGDEF)-like protein